MKPEPAYQAYLAALGIAVDLPRAEAAELDEIERRCRSEFDALDHTRRDAAVRWVGMRDDCARLSRRVDELARRVDAPPVSGPVSDLHAPAALPRALESLRSELEQADQAWQWVLRHRERRATPPVTAPPSPSAPVSTPPPASAPIPAPASKSVDPKLLLAVAVVVIVLLVLVVIVMAI